MHGPLNVKFGDSSVVQGQDRKEHLYNDIQHVALSTQ